MPYKFDYNRAPAAIILACQDPGYEIYDLGRLGDVYRNRDLLELFEGVDVLAIDGITPRFAEMKKADDFSEAFEARRAGEVLRWSTDRGITERLVEAGQPAWRILDREMNYLAVGPAKRQQAIRIRGLRDPAAAREAAKLEKREMGRRQRAHDKTVAWRRDTIRKALDKLMRLRPEAPLPEELGRFKVDGCDLLRNYRDVLIDAAADADGKMIWELVDMMAVRAGGEDLKARMAAQREAARAPVVPDDDADVMGDLGF